MEEKDLPHFGAGEFGHKLSVGRTRGFCGEAAPVIGLLRRRESQDTVNKKVTKSVVERRDTV